MVEDDTTMVDEIAQIILRRHGLSVDDKPIIHKYLNEAIWKILTETRAMDTKRTIPDFDPGVLDTLENQIEQERKQLESHSVGEEFIREKEDEKRE